MPECRVVFENRLPDHWQATVTTIATVLYYKGADESELEAYAAQKEVKLGTNQADQLDSNDPSKCVGKVYVAVAVKSLGREDGSAEKTFPNVPSSCTEEIRVILTANPDAGSIENITDLDSENAFDLQMSRK